MVAIRAGNQSRHQTDTFSFRSAQVMDGRLGQRKAMEDHRNGHKNGLLHTLFESFRLLLPVKRVSHESQFGKAIGTSWGKRMDRGWTSVGRSFL